MNPSISDLVTGGSILVSATMGWAVLRGHFSRLLNTAESLVAGLNEQMGMLSKMVTLLTDLTTSHSRERADDSGFGTIEVTRNSIEILSEIELLKTQQQHDREMHATEHGNIIATLKRIEANAG